MLERDVIIKLFKRIGDQSDLKKQWDSMPNAERNCIAGALYNILIEYAGEIRKEEQARVLKAVKEGIDKYMFTDPKARGHRTIHENLWKVIESISTTGPRRAPAIDLMEENKPGCFGAIGLPGKRKDPNCPCEWKDRCRQSQVDY